MTTAGAVAIELRKLADALDKEPELQVFRPEIDFLTTINAPVHQAGCICHLCEDWRNRQMSRTHTSILTLCHCGHVGIASSSHEALQQWYQHSFDAVGGMHERVGEMAIANPLNALGLYRIRQEAMEQARLARWRGYQKQHGEFETEPLGVVEARLRRGAMAAITITLAVAGIVWAVVR